MYRLGKHVEVISLRLFRRNQISRLGPSRQQKNLATGQMLQNRLSGLVTVDSVHHYIHYSRIRMEFASHSYRLLAGIHSLGIEPLGFQDLYEGIGEQWIIIHYQNSMIQRHHDYCFR